MSSKWVNRHSLEAKNRKLQIQNEKKEKLKEELENYKWIDDDKHIRIKDERRLKKEEKNALIAERKAEKKRLEEEDAKNIISNKVNDVGSTKTKLTKYELLTRQLKQVEDIKNYLLKKNDQIAQIDITPNINHTLRQQVIEDYKTGKVNAMASGIDDALTVLQGSKNVSSVTTMNYQIFYNLHIDELKKEYPTAKQSQLIDRIKKKWAKSHLNPANNKSNK